MSMRVLLCGVLALSVFSTQAGVLPKPRLPAPSKALNEELGATREPPNPKGCEAHHIVPRGENRMWAREFAESARESRAGCVDLDSAENGVYLPANENGSCRGRYHRGLHTKKYYSEIAERLELARTTGGCRGVSDELSNIKTELSVGP